ncbi:hypothetical protein N665_0031s0005 [Sinapis alba]|nr:hypothetical protein N665_0031s0005 [Sinapis alba]
MIDVEAIIDGIKVFMTFVYGDHVLERRDQVWERLTRFSTTRTGLWFMIGDFNEITDHNEKEGGRRRLDNSFLPFKQMLSDCGMIEFPFTGNMLSWVGKRAGGSTVRCKLDRAVGNEDWLERFPHTAVKYLKLWGSDHRPVLADILTKPTKRSKSFKFDKRWFDSEELRHVILEGWKSVDLPQKQVEKLKEKVECMYDNDDATTEEIAVALKDYPMLLRQRRSFGGKKVECFGFEREIEILNSFMQ